MCFVNNLDVNDLSTIFTCSMSNYIMVSGFQNSWPNNCYFSIVFQLSDQLNTSDDRMIS